MAGERVGRGEGRERGKTKSEKREGIDLSLFFDLVFLEESVDFGKVKMLFTVGWKQSSSCIFVSVWVRFLSSACVFACAHLATFNDELFLCGGFFICVFM